MSVFCFMDQGEIAGVGMDHENDPNVVGLIQYVYRCEAEIRRLHAALMAIDMVKPVLNRGQRNKSA